MDAESRLTFTITPWRPWLLVVAMLAVPAMLGATVAIAAGEPAAAAIVLLGFAGLAVAFLVPIGLAARVSRWHVDRRGRWRPRSGVNGDVARLRDRC